MILLFSVKNQSLTLNTNLKKTEIIADSRNYLKVKFNFYTADWQNNKIKYALFTHNGKTYKKILGVEKGVEWNECFVPHEVIKEGQLDISVYCEDLITTNKVSIPIGASGYTEKIENQQATPSVTEQMNTLMYKYASLCNQIHKECVTILETIKGGTGDGE